MHLSYWATHHAQSVLLGRLHTTPSSATAYTSLLYSQRHHTTTPSRLTRVNFTQFRLSPRVVVADVSTHRHQTIGTGFSLDSYRHHERAVHHLICLWPTRRCRHHQRLFYTRFHPCLLQLCRFAEIFHEFITLYSVHV